MEDIVINMVRQESRNEWPIQELENWRPRSASIVIDNYNYGSFIGEAIDSALAQTHPAQVIVVDDGSTDFSRDVIHKYEGRIEMVLKSNGGQGSALNAGYARATGDIVLFLDSDDLMEANSIETLLQVWRRGTAVSHFRMRVIDSGGRQVGFIPGPGASLAEGDLRSELLYVGNFRSTVTSGMAFSRLVLDQIMPVPESRFTYSADGYLVRAAAFFGPFQFVDTHLALYRVHEKNNSNPWGKKRTLAAGVRNRIRAFQMYLDTVRTFADKFQLHVASDFGEHFYHYLEYRLFSLVLDPANHPVAGDRRLPLLFHFIRSYWTAPLSFRHKVKESLVLVVCAITGRNVAEVLIRWTGDANARPGWLSFLSSLPGRLSRKRPAPRSAAVNAAKLSKDENTR